MDVHTSQHPCAGIRVSISKITTLEYSSPARSMTSAITAINRIPQYASEAVLTYTGDLAAEKWVSVVDLDYNEANPCVTGTVAAATADSTHSGALQAASGEYSVTIPQSTLLDESKTYAVCYAETSGASNDVTWRDSNIRLLMSKILSIHSHAVTHTTYGQIANVDSLQITYLGSLVNQKWLAFADQSLSGQDPCASPDVPVSISDALHSGHYQAASGSKVVTLDTTAMDTSTTFALCYTEATDVTYFFGRWPFSDASRSYLPDMTVSWVDSGLRMTVSKISAIEYQDELPYGEAKRSFTSTNVPAPTNRLPQVADVDIRYIGDVDNYKWLSLVDSTLTGLNGNDPCVSGAVAAPITADATHTGALQASIGTKLVTVPQAVLLDETKVFAVCYAEVDGATTDTSWADSYIRLETSKVQSIVAHSVTHKTVGQLPSQAELLVTYTGVSSTCL